MVEKAVMGWVWVREVGSRKAEPNVIISGFGGTCDEGILCCSFLFPALLGSGLAGESPVLLLVSLCL